MCYIYILFFDIYIYITCVYITYIYIFNIYYIYIYNIYLYIHIYMVCIYIYIYYSWYIYIYLNSIWYYVKLCQFSPLSWQPQDGWKHIFWMHFLFILSQWEEGGRAWRPLRGRIWSEDSQKEPRASTTLTAWLGPFDISIFAWPHFWWKQLRWLMTYDLLIFPYRVTLAHCRLWLMGGLCIFYNSV